MADLVIRTDARAIRVRSVRNSAWSEAIRANDRITWSLFNGLDLKVTDELKEPQRTSAVSDYGWGGGLQRANYD